MNLGSLLLKRIQVQSNGCSSNQKRISVPSAVYEETEISPLIEPGTGLLDNIFTNKNDITLVCLPT